MMSKDNAVLEKIVDNKLADIAWIIRDPITEYLSKKSEV